MDWNMEDAVRDLARAIKGNAEANEALDRLVARSWPETPHGFAHRVNVQARIATTRSAA